MRTPGLVLSALGIVLFLASKWMESGSPEGAPSNAGLVQMAAMVCIGIGGLLVWRASVSRR